MQGNDAQAALAAAAAQIAQLNTELEQERSHSQGLSQQISTLTEQITSANTRASGLQAQISSLNDAHQREKEILQAQIGQEAARATIAEENRAALETKFAQLYGSVDGEVGIARGPQLYIVEADKSEHPTLESAKCRRLALELGVGDHVAGRFMNNPNFTYEWKKP